MLAGGSQGPKMKRRREEDEWGDDEWDNDDFSQAQLDDIDNFVASQSVNPANSHMNNNSIKPNPSPGARKPVFAKPSKPPSKNIPNSFSHSSNVQSQLAELQDENRKLKELNGQLQKDSYTNQGQVKNLRTKIQTTEADIARLKMEKVAYIEEEEKRKMELNNQQKKEVERLKVELQFKDKELQEMQHSIRKLERKNQAEDGIPQSQSPGLKSPSRMRQLQKSPKTPRSKGFPINKDTFLSNEASPPKRYISKDASTQGSSSTMSAPETKQIIGRGRQRRLGLSVDLSVGCTSGPQLVEKMMSSNESVSKHGQESSSDGLLSILSNQTDTCHHRLHDASELLGIPKPEQDPVPQTPHMDPEKISLARRGIESLLKSNLVDTKIKNKIQQLNNADSAVLLLPLLEEHLQVYIEGTQNHPKPEKTEASSVESSVGSTLSFPLSAETISQTERCQSVLSLLLTLVTYSKEICTAIITGITGSKEMDTDQSNRLSHSGSNDSRSNTPLPANCKAEIVRKCHIFDKLTSISDPDFISEREIPMSVIEGSLSVLTVLAQQCNRKDLNIYLCLFPSENGGRGHGCAVVHCLEHADKHPSIIHYVIELFISLARCEKVIRIFSENKEDICVLTKLYDSLLQLPKSYPTPQRLALKQRLITFLSVTLEDKHNIDRILNAHCVCGDEIIHTIITLLHQEVPQLDGEDKDCVKVVKDLLHAGVRLLHSLSAKEDHFRRYALQVEKYAQLMYAYEDLTQAQAEKDDALSRIISDVWIFEDVEEEDDSFDEYMDIELQ